MGHEVDEQGKDFPGKAGCLCRRLRNFLFRILLRDLLAKKEVFNARTHFLE